MENKGYAKFWGANKVHYGNCGSGIIGKTFVTHNLLNTKNIPCCMYTWIAQLPIIVFTCHYVYARSLGRGFTEQRYEIYALIQSICNRSLPINTNLSIDCYWNSIPVNITTSIFAIDGSSITSSNRLIDIDWYWLISIVIDYPFIYWIPPGKLWQVFFWAAWFK